MENYISLLQLRLVVVRTTFAKIQELLTKIHNVPAARKEHIHHHQRDFHCETLVLVVIGQHSTIASMHYLGILSSDPNLHKIFQSKRKICVIV